MKLQTAKEWLASINRSSTKQRLAYEAGLRSVLEYIYQLSESACPLCQSETYPVDEHGKRIYTQNVEHAVEWDCCHDDDCLVTVIEKSLNGNN